MEFASTIPAKTTIPHSTGGDHAMSRSHNAPRLPIPCSGMASIKTNPMAKERKYTTSSRYTATRASFNPVFNSLKACNMVSMSPAGLICAPLGWVNCILAGISTLIVVSFSPSSL